MADSRVIMARQIGRQVSASRRRHWDTIYRTKAEDELSWHQEKARLSLRLISGIAARSSRIVDIGGGSSPLAGDLLSAGFEHITVVDISPISLERSRGRAADGGNGIRYRTGDITRLSGLGRFDVWHDRAVLHFLTDARDRRHYVELAAQTIPIGGHLVLAAFGLSGPERCSGLPVVRYDARRLAREFGERFALRKQRSETHQTPWGTQQPFTYVVLQRVRRGNRSAGRPGSVPARPSN